MKKQTFTKQAVWQAAAVGVLAVGGVLFWLSGQIGIGQTYRQVRVDDRIIGYAPEKTDMDDIVRPVSSARLQNFLLIKKNITA